MFNSRYSFEYRYFYSFAFLILGFRENIGLLFNIYISVVYGVKKQFSNMVMVFNIDIFLPMLYFCLWVL